VHDTLEHFGWIPNLGGQGVKGGIFGHGFGVCTVLQNNTGKQKGNKDWFPNAKSVVVRVMY